MTYDQIKSRLVAIEEDLAVLSIEENHPAYNFFREKRDYERAYSEEYVMTTGTVDERKNQTLLALVKSGLYQKFVIAEAEYETYKARSRVLETRASIGQSLLRAETREAFQGGPQPAWSAA